MSSVATEFFYSNQKTKRLQDRQLMSELGLYDLRSSKIVTTSACLKQMIEKLSVTLPNILVLEPNVCLFTRLH